MSEGFGGAPVLDVAQALAGMDNDRGAYAEICEVLLGEVPGLLAALRAAAGEGAPRVARVLHEMASSMAIVGALEAARELRGLERALREGAAPADGLAGAARRAEASWLQVDAAVRQWLRGRGAPQG